MKKFKPLLILIFGASRSGKDKMGSVFEQYYLERIHPIADLKEFLEEHFGTPNLDTDEGKAYKPCKYLDITMQDIMVSSYHFWERLGIPFTYFYVCNVLERLSGAEQNAFMLGIRNMHEYTAIEEFQDDFTIVTIKIDRPVVQGISTDHLVEQIFDKASKISHDVIYVKNDKGLDEWLNTSHDIIEYLFKTYNR